MKKPNVAIASVLKPLKDARAYYRLGLSLRETNKYHLNIIGFSLKNVPNEKDISFFTLFDKNRTHWKRLLVSLKFVQTIQKTKPKILIVTSYELLPAAVLIKAILRFRLIYDVQENYGLNIQENQTQKGWKRHVAKYWIRGIEKLAHRFVDHYFFAESCYRHEFPYIDKFTVLENKFPGKPKPILPVQYRQGQCLTFLISGTITEVYGIKEAIIWFTEALKHQPNLRLKIIGYCPMKSYRIGLDKIIQGIPQIQAKISDSAITYPEILVAYQHSDIIMLPYYQIPSISPKVPSKLYESLALGKPFLHSPNPKWASLSDRYQAGVEVEFSDLGSVKKHLDEIVARPFFTGGMDGLPFWNEHENQRLLGVIVKYLDD
ncbi:hypothetical protein ACFSKL_14430 [Belliella marina]|uniref:Uncharacterized protein n=1 Tax=Belliella marina TaxID=1644146 RepID=A0ABW4VRT3_9BACT